MEVLFKNKTKCTEKEYELFLEEYKKEFSMSENLYTLFNIFFFGLCVWLAFSGGEIWLGIVIILGLLIYIWYKFIRPIKRVEKDKKSNKIKDNFVNTFTFYKNSFKVKNPDGEAEIFYYKLYRVLETNTHFYIFISREYAFIVAKNGFEDNKSDEFSKFIKKKSLGKYKNKMTKNKLSSNNGNKKK